MRRFWPVLLFVAIFAAVLLRPQHGGEQAGTDSGKHYQRIISLAPSITETAFAIGLGDRIIAVTDYCRYPAQARTLPKVGGYFDTSLETVVALQPDLVLLLDRQPQLQQQLQSLGIDSHSVDHASVDGILSAISSIGQITGQQAQAQALLADIRQQIDRVSAQVGDQTPTRALIAIAHYVSGQQLESVYIAGQHDFYNDLLQLAGGENVYRDGLIKVPSLSVEGVMRLDPDVIIDLLPAGNEQQASMEQAQQQWQSLQQVSAVRNGRVHVIQNDYVSIPGPRIFRLLPQLARWLHPDLDWEDTVSDD